jgi:hypothetical protein
MKAMADMREACGPTPPSDEVLRPAIEDGFNVFEGDRQREGDEEACTGLG